jgi:hypothetical protein
MIVLNRSHARLIHLRGEKHMRMAKVLSFTLGALLIFLGVTGIAFAQNDGCGLIVKRHPANPQNVWQFGCPTGQVCQTNSGNTNCTPGFRQDSYGNNWMICECVGWRGTYIGEHHVGDDLCLVKFLPHDPQDPGGTGSYSCHQEDCGHPCNQGWSQDPVDPELEVFDCNC